MNNSDNSNHYLYLHIQHILVKALCEYLKFIIHHTKAWTCVAIFDAGVGNRACVCCWCCSLEHHSCWSIICCYPYNSSKAKQCFFEGKQGWFFSRYSNDSFPWLDERLTQFERRNDSMNDMKWWLRNVYVKLILVPIAKFPNYVIHISLSQNSQLIQIANSQMKKSISLAV